MNKRWTTYSGLSSRSRKARPRVSLRNGDMAINDQAYSAMGRPEAVELLFDQLSKIIGLRPAAADLPNAAVVGRYQHGRTYHRLSIGRFCNYFGIDVPHRFQFEDAHVDADGIMVLSLKAAVLSDDPRCK